VQKDVQDLRTMKGGFDYDLNPHDYYYLDSMRYLRDYQETRNSLRLLNNSKWLTKGKNIVFV